MKDKEKKGIFHGIRRAFQAKDSRFESEAFDPELYYPVIRASICTGEKVAGFRNRRTGSFTEVMLIRTPRDEQEFKEKYRVDKLDTEY